jgi:hypothetical protein
MKNKFLRGEGTRLSVRAVKGAWVRAFTGAKRKPLTEEAGGSGAGFSQEGMTNCGAGVCGGQSSYETPNEASKRFFDSDIK